MSKGIKEIIGWILAAVALFFTTILAEVVCLFLKFGLPVMVILAVIYFCFWLAGIDLLTLFK